jgi:hypothetical protein
LGRLTWVGFPVTPQFGFRSRVPCRFLRGILQKVALRLVQRFSLSLVAPPPSDAISTREHPLVSPPRHAPKDPQLNLMIALFKLSGVLFGTLFKSALFAVQLTQATHYFRQSRKDSQVLKVAIGLTIAIDFALLLGLTVFLNLVCHLSPRNRI